MTVNVPRFPQVTDLDLSVLKRIAASLTASLSGSAASADSSSSAGPQKTSQAAATSKTAARGMASGSVAFALDKTQRRTVAALRQAFRRADINGDGFLDRDEVEALLRHHLEVQGLSAGEMEAEVAQFIA